MNVYLSKLTYEYSDDGKIKDAIVGLNGMEDDQFTDSQLKITADDLAEGQTFDTINNQDLIALARQKLINYISGK
jgi:hypothetical protein